MAPTGGVVRRQSKGEMRSEQVLGPLPAAWDGPLLIAAAGALLLVALVNAWRPGALFGSRRASALTAVRALVLVAPVLALTAYSIDHGTGRWWLHGTVAVALGLLEWWALPWWLLAMGVIAIVAAYDRRHQPAWRGLGQWAKRWAAPVSASLSRRRWLLAFLALVALTVGFVFPDILRPFLAAEPPDAAAYNYILPFTYGTGPEARLLTSMQGYVLGHFGLALPPHAGGEIAFQFDRTPGSQVFVSGTFYDRVYDIGGLQLQAGPLRPQPNSAFPNRLDVSADGGRTWIAALQNRTLQGGERLRLDPLLGTATHYLVRFSATNTSDVEVPVLAVVNVDTVLDPASFPAAGTDDVVFLMAAGTVLFLALTWAGVAGQWSSTLAGGAFVCAALILGGHRDALGWARPAFWVLWAASLAVAAVRARSRPADSRQLDALWVLVAAAVVVLAWDLRWALLYDTRFSYLAPDAQGYKSWAMSIPEREARFRVNPLFMFYSGAFGVREPLWIFVVHGFFRALGTSSFHIRLASLVFSVVVVYLTYAVGRRVAHPLAGLVAAFLVAINSSHVENSVLGLREEFVTAGLFVFLYLLLFWRGAEVRVAARSAGRPLVGAALGAGTGRAARWLPPAVGALGAALVLTRSELSLLVMVLLTGAALWRRWSKGSWALAMGVLLTLIVPMYAGFAFASGDPFLPSTFGATVNRNLEFPELHGTPGFPSEEAFKRDWAAGPSIGPGTYLFGYHSVPQIAAYSVRGLVVIFRDIFFREQRWLLVGFFAGVALMLWHRQWLVPVLIVVLLAPPYAFLAGAPNDLFPARYAHHALPWVGMAVGYAAAWVSLVLIGGGGVWSRSLRWSVALLGAPARALAK